MPDIEPKAYNSPIQANWAQIAIKYAQGIPSHELEAEYGVKASTIRQRAARHGWSIKALNASHSDQINSSHTEPLNTPQSLSNPIVGVNKACNNVSQAAFASAQRDKEIYTSCLAKASRLTVQQAVDEVEKEQTLVGKALIFSSLEPMARVMKPIYGLGNEVPGQNNVQVNVLSGWGDTDVVDV